MRWTARCRCHRWTGWGRGGYAGCPTHREHTATGVSTGPHAHTATYHVFHISPLCSTCSRCLPYLIHSHCRPHFTTVFHTSSLCSTYHYRLPCLSTVFNTSPLLPHNITVFHTSALSSTHHTSSIFHTSITVSGTSSQSPTRHTVFHIQ